MAKAIEVRLSGGCVVSCDGVPDEMLSLRGKKGAALMTFLIFSEASRFRCRVSSGNYGSTGAVRIPKPDE